MKEFSNEAFLNFADSSISEKQKQAIMDVRSRFGKEYPNIIGGKEVLTQNKTKSINPANRDEVIGIFQKAGKDEAEAAMQTAVKAFETWKKVPPAERADYLFKAAEVIRKRRMEINAWMISEVGKNYLEADADTCEAIDFLEFYGREMLRYAEEQPVVPYPGEKNEYFYIPLGVGVIIPPWNFPFAILIGMASAAIVAGNTVVVKPSSDAPMMGWLFADIMKSIGLPDGVFNYCVASGAETGDYFVDHPKTRFISFTGSMEVGLRIVERAGKTNPGQIWIKRVVAEMGGKDAILVDSEADIDSAVQGTLTAAFGFQGQKCSACSRVIVDKAVYDEFVSKLVEKVKDIKVGNPMDNFLMGPVINERSEQNVLNYIEIGKKDGKLLHGGKKVEGLNGFFIEPTIIGDIKPNDRLAQEEVFGPLLAVIKSENFDDGLNIVNGTIFGLTGALYSKNEEKLARARCEFHVGNLYLNRKCTGALVGVQPFGGFNMSGTDSKAGSRDYLMLFMQGKSVCKKL